MAFRVLSSVMSTNFIWKADGAAHPDHKRGCVVKRETGARPVRTRHCKQGIRLSFRDKRRHWETGKTDGRVVICKPGDLPFVGTGLYPGHEELTVLFDRPKGGHTGPFCHAIDFSFRNTE